MKRLVSFFLVVVFIHIIYGFYISSWNPTIMPVNYSSTPAGQTIYFDYSGCINVKSTKSTGSKDYLGITTAANDAQVDFVIATDLNDFSPSFEQQGYLNNVLLMIGGDFGFLEGRILNFDLKDTGHLQGPGRSQSAFADILSVHNHHKDSGVFVLTHPLKPGYKLTAPMPEGIDGIELMNLKDVWQRAWLNSKLSFLWSMVVYPFNSKLSYLRMLALYGEQEIALWDKLNQSRSVFGFMGSAAEANTKILKNFSLEFPSYSTIFSIVRNHVLLKTELIGNAELDRKKITEALRAGQFYMSIDILQNPKGFEAFVQNKQKEIFPVGSTIKFTEGTDLVMKLPEKPNLKFETVIFKDGEKILTSNSALTRYIIHGPGVYRGVVRIKVPFPFPERSKWLNWIMTNPFYVQ